VKWKARKEEGLEEGMGRGRTEMEWVDLRREGESLP